MKKVKTKMILHVLSAGVAIIFLFFAMASSPLFGTADYREGPCEPITPVSVSYTVTIKVTDEVSGEPIPGANVDIEITHSIHKYLGESKCQLSPGAESYKQLSRITNSAGIITLDLTTVTYKVNIDKTRIDVLAIADHYATADATRQLSPGSPSTVIDVKLIDLTTQP